jgi:hypothetical protein
LLSKGIYGGQQEVGGGVDGRTVMVEEDGSTGVVYARFGDKGKAEPFFRIEVEVEGRAPPGAGGDIFPSRGKVFGGFLFLLHGR